ncbi:hypothetical protein FZC33_24770 [Labrys sp. KNU-23]|uniref:hypothetical protein n=1 Tax=Labrys sp. KNU-23 TaxID=2789216 RepID=UPI0011EE51A3|nr:hypothetical protein [Labrys sp. KNU-23]QEN89322.1 hypothetical protein FZC33_24770 [Labrys sp. KNU-23]
MRAPALAALFILAAIQSALACSVVPDKAPAERGPALPVYGAEVRLSPGETCTLLDWGSNSAGWQPLGPAKAVVQGATLGKAWISRARGMPKLIYKAPPDTDGQDEVRQDEVRLNNALAATVTFKITITP